ncbi:MAG: hypothetical protein QXN55_08765 [Candidatus Nitrosotenuis sp.]
MKTCKKNHAKKHTTKLGDLLVRHGANENKVSMAALEYYGRNMFGEYCVNVGACTREQLNLALSDQAIERGDFEEATNILKENNTNAHKYVIGILNKSRGNLNELLTIQIGLPVKGS